jgi:hypothetical protein
MFLRQAAAMLAVVGFAAATTLTQAPDPMVGTWKLNVAKSKSPYKSGSTVIEKTGDTLKVTADLVTNDGTSYHWTWSATEDGKDTPVTGRTPYGDGVVASLTRVDAHTVKIVGKHNGAVVLNQTVTVSADGKTRTVTSKGKDTKGQPIDTASFYDKQ